MAKVKPAVRIAYTLTLTEGEYRSLQWLEDRGYAADLIKHATEVDDESTPGTVVLKYRESDAWNVGDAARDDETGDLSHDFGACAGRELLRKMIAFVAGIV